MVTADPHWEPPVPRKILITVHALGEMLDLPYWKAREVAWSLDQRFVGEKGGGIRVTLVSAEIYLELDVAGLPAQAIMAERKRRGARRIEGWGQTPRSAQHSQRLAEEIELAKRAWETRPVRSTAHRRRRRWS